MSRDYIPKRFKALIPSLIDFLIPSSEDMPSATDAEVDTRWANQVLSIRHDLREPFFRGLRFIENQMEEGIAIALEELKTNDFEAYESLGIVVVGGYFLNPDIREKIGYPGQKPWVDYEAKEVPDYVSDGLLAPVLKSKQLYRSIEDSKQTT